MLIYFQGDHTYPIQLKDELRKCLIRYALFCVGENVTEMLADEALKYQIIETIQATGSRIMERCKWRSNDRKRVEELLCPMLVLWETLP